MLRLKIIKIFAKPHKSIYRFNCDTKIQNSYDLKIKKKVMQNTLISFSQLDGFVIIFLIYVSLCVTGLINDDCR